MTEPSDHQTLLQALQSIINALPPSPPPYCLIGALALGAWGQVRATQDIDLLVLLEDDQLDGLQEVLAPIGFTLDVGWAETNPMLKGQVIRFRHVDYPLDLLTPRDEHDQEVLQRRQKLRLEDFSIWVCGPEDLIVLKLKAGRPRDFEDALSVVLLQGTKLDLDYLWSWADRLGLQGELQYVLNAAAPPS